MGGEFKQLTEADLVCESWFERDRAHLRLETPSGRVIFELWDDDLHSAIQDGFLSAPRHPRPTDDMWKASAIAYAKETGLLTAEGTLPPPRPTPSRKPRP